MKPVLLDRQTAYKGYLTVDRLRLQSPDGATVWREIQCHGDAVAVLPYDPGKRCALLIHSFRAPVFAASGADYLEEVCAGMIGAGEDDVQAVRREAVEELGLTIEKLEPIARVWSSAGTSTERVSLYLARYGEHDRHARGGGRPEEHENINVIERPLRLLLEEARAGRIGDSKLLIAVLALFVREPGLFEPPE